MDRKRITFRCTKETELACLTATEREIVGWMEKHGVPWDVEETTGMLIVLETSRVGRELVQEWVDMPRTVSDARKWLGY